MRATRTTSSSTDTAATAASMNCTSRISCTVPHARGAPSSNQNPHASTLRTTCLQLRPAGLRLPGAQRGCHRLLRHQRHLHPVPQQLEGHGLVPDRPSVRERDHVPRRCSVQPENRLHRRARGVRGRVCVLQLHRRRPMQRG
jgi:hypothetical protein